MDSSKILIGSTFPLSLIRRQVVISVHKITELKAKIEADGFVSFWGHDNTLSSVGNVLQADLKPETTRPAISLTTDKLPQLGGEVFRECWVLSPDYVPGFRPSIGVEVSQKEITGWQVLRLLWLT